MKRPCVTTAELPRGYAFAKLRKEQFVLMKSSLVAYALRFTASAALMAA